MQVHGLVKTGELTRIQPSTQSIIQSGQDQTILIVLRLNHLR